MREIYVFGHKNPDTDSVTSAISFSYLKNKLGIKAKPMILGNINKETEFVLNYFNTPIPDYLEDVKLQIKDLNYYKNCYINKNASLGKTYSYMNEKNITGVPIVDDDNKFIGLVTSKMIGAELINGDFTKLHTSYENILKILNGKEILKIDNEIKGKILVAGYGSTTILSTVKFDKDTIMIVGDRHNIIKEAIEKGIRLLIVVGNFDIKEEHMNLAKQNKVNIIKTNYDTFHTSKLIGLSNYIKNLITNSRNISFNENDYYDDFKEKSIRLGYNNYPVIDDYNNCLGLIRITDINKTNKKEVILVDHNDSNQSVEGLDEAQILEIIDHHNLGSITTNMPVNFRNMTVGSTNTIIYSIYNENNISVPPEIAGLMLSGIISDTLKFTSPTTTQIDKYVAKRLAAIASIDIEKYANEMFRAGTNLAGKKVDDIIKTDMKTYEVNGKTIAISQVITLNSEEILEQKDSYIQSLNQIKDDRDLNLVILCVTDIIKNGSYIFYDEDNEQLLADAFNLENIKQGYFFEECLSRKKQLVPIIMNVIR